MIIRCMGCMEEYDNSKGMCPQCGYAPGAVPVEAFHLAPGTIVANRYTIGKVLGFGGFGVTYIAWDKIMEKKVAIKEYLPSEFATRVPAQTRVSVYRGEKAEQFHAGMDRFVEEARKLAKFKSDTEIVNVYDCIQENETAYIIMELLEGESLKECLQKVGRMSVEEAEKIILPIAESLKLVHSEGLIHRDIAPDNIFLTKDGRVKLLDFGAARYASATHSRSLSVIYKPGYAPEEQYQSRGEQGPWTDIYALAATFYKMITGITPDTSPERRAHDTLKAPSKLGVSIAKNKEIALLNALNVQAENRTRCAEDFLAEWNSETSVKRLIDSVKKIDIGALSTKWKVLILLAAAVVAIVVGVLVTTVEKQPVNGEIALGQNEVRVPSVVNETLDVAQQNTETAGLILQIVDTEYDKEIAKGLILTQNSPAGSVQSKGAQLEVVVSGGIRQIYMPEVIGTDREKAKQSVEDAGFSVSEEERYSAMVAGSVIDASISVGTQCDEGTAVVLYISKGIDPATLEEERKPFTVKNYVGKTYEEVRSELEEAMIGINYTPQYSDTVPKGKIISQSVQENKTLLSGDSIILYISLGKEMVRVPEMVYQSLEEAKKALDDVGLIMESEEVFDAKVKVGLIVSQSIEGGAEVDKGSKILLKVSKGAEPTPEPTATNTPEPTPTNTPIPTETPTPTPTPTPEPTPTNTPIPTETPMPTSTPTPTPTPTKTPTPTPKPKYTYKTLTKYMWTTAGVNVRNLPTSIGSTVIGEIVSNTKVYVTGQCNETSWYRVEVDGKTGYVTYKYLTDKAVVTNTPTPTKKPAAKPTAAPTQMPSYLEEVVSKNWLYYILEDGSVLVRGYQGTSRDVTIPSKYNGGSVIGIVDNAFADNLNLRSITLPDTVKTIGNGAFDGCKNLQNVTLSSNLTHIGDEAFFQCEKLKAITLPNSLRYLGESAFMYCYALESISIPGNVGKIGDYCFFGCELMTSVKLSSGIKIIGEYAFSNCTRITEVTVPDTVAQIEGSAFYMCTGLRKATVPASVTKIGEDVFADDTAIVVYVKSGSYAYNYMRNNGISYKTY